MDDELLLGGIIILTIFGGAICGIVAVFQIRTLKEQLQKLQKSFDELFVNHQRLTQKVRDSERAIKAAAQEVEAVQSAAKTTPESPEPDINSAPAPTSPEIAKVAPQTGVEQAPTETESIQASEPTPETHPIPTTAPQSTAQSVATAQKVTAESTNRNTKAQPTPSQSTEPTLMGSIQQNWMVWLGGLCVSLAGIFLVKYSIDIGLIGPKTRIVLAILLGVSLHLGAEFLRRRTGEHHDSFAALAGGGSITIYAALLAALHFYQMLPPMAVFILLAIVSMATMAAALRHGPVLAAIGILGAYVVPIFVNTGSNNVTAALIYSFIVTVAALFLIRFIFRQWLWYGTLSGAAFWLLVSMAHPSELALVRALYCCALAYSVIAIHFSDWTLRKVLIEQPLGEWFAMTRVLPT